MGYDDRGRDRGAEHTPQKNEDGDDDDAHAQSKFKTPGPEHHRLPPSVSGLTVSVSLDFSAELQKEDYRLWLRDLRFGLRPRPRRQPRQGRQVASCKLHGTMAYGTHDAAVAMARHIWHARGECHVSQCQCRVTGQGQVGL